MGSAKPLILVPLSVKRLSVDDPVLGVLQRLADDAPPVETAFAYHDRVKLTLHFIRRGDRVSRG